MSRASGPALPDWLPGQGRPAARTQDRNARGVDRRRARTLLVREKEHTRLGDELARQRRELPWVRVEKDYRLDTDDGPRTLAELFDGRSQLLIYHFMFGPSYRAGCPVNSSIADSIDGAHPAPEGARRDDAAGFAGPPREVAGVQAADGLERPLGVVGQQRLQPRPRILEQPRNRRARGSRRSSSSLPPIVDAMPARAAPTSSGT